MLIQKLKSKIHLATVTECHLNYNGSLGLDEDFMQLADLQEFEKVLVANVSNGKRFETYIIKEKKGSKKVTLNGAAARLGQEGDKIIILSFCLLDEKESAFFKPSIVIMEETNIPKKKS